MRLLNNRNQLLDIRGTGMSPRIAERYIEDVLDAPRRPTSARSVLAPKWTSYSMTELSCIQEKGCPEEQPRFQQE
jgi:hypothetical protein